MRTVRLLFAVLAATSLVACLGTFFHYQREFVVEYDQPLRSDERRAVFQSFKAYLQKQGRAALFEREVDGVSSVTFRTHRVGYGPESDLFADLIDLKYIEGGNFTLKVYRNTVLKSEFTADGLTNFVNEMEASIQAASGKKVRLRVSGSGT